MIKAKRIRLVLLSISQDEVLLSIDKILVLLAHDFERYENISKDAHNLHCYVFSHNEVTSLRFDVEGDINLEYFESSSGGVCGSSLNVNTNDNFYYVKNVLEMRSRDDTFSSCFHEVEMSSDYSCDEKGSDDISLDGFDMFEAHSYKMFEEDIDIDQHSECEHFHDDSYTLIINPLFECQEVATLIKFDLVSNEIANEEESYFLCPSYLDAQGELQIHDVCDTLSQIVYKVFVFPIDSIHESICEN